MKAGRWDRIGKGTIKNENSKHLYVQYHRTFYGRWDKISNICTCYFHLSSRAANQDDFEQQTAPIADIDMTLLESYLPYCVIYHLTIKHYLHTFCRSSLYYRSSDNLHLLSHKCLHGGKGWGDKDLALKYWNIQFQLLLTTKQY